MDFIKKWMRRRRHRERREARMAAAQEKGYQIMRKESEKAHAYTIVAPDGSLLDNDGLGYPTSSDAFAAVLRHERQQVQVTRERQQANEAV